MLRMKTVSVDMFFSAERIKRAVDKATRDKLKKAGAYVRTAARSSIKDRKGAAKPGRPPSSHTGLLRHFIFFGYDKQRKTVVVGPMRLNQKIGVAPEALEKGGRSMMLVGRRNKRRRKAIRIKPHPFMGPALEKEAPKFPDLWTNSVR